MYKLVFTKQAQRDAKKISTSILSKKVKKLLGILEKDPYKQFPKYKKLVGDLSGTYSRRINRQHRLVYQIYDKKKTVKVIRMWTHYE